MTIAPEVWVFGGAGLISLLAFATLILAPAVGAFGRGWEKATAVVLSVLVLAALIGVGAAIGVALVYYWNDISAWFS